MSDLALSALIATLVAASVMPIAGRVAATDPRNWVIIWLLAFMTAYIALADWIDIPGIGG